LSKHLCHKHLCGVASDFAIRCFKNSIGSVTGTGSNQPLNKCSGLVLALCCHHKCEWASFCGKEYMKTLGIDEPMFYLLRSMTSWSVCEAWSANEKVDDDGNIRFFTFTYLNI
jgi:tRNA:m4X modification enzyme